MGWRGTEKGPNGEGALEGTGKRTTAAAGSTTGHAGGWGARGGQQEGAGGGGGQSYRGGGVAGCGKGPARGARVGWGGVGWGYNPIKVS